MCRPTGCSHPCPVPLRKGDSRALWEDSSSSSEPESDTSDSESEADCVRRSHAATRRWSGASKTLPSAGPVVKSPKAAPPRPEACTASLSVLPHAAAPKSQAAQACFLRKENSRLRQVLARAQRRAEEATASQPAPQGELPDLAHLLALARELDCGDCCVQEVEESGFVSISTPRSDCRPGASAGEAEVSSLREALRQSEEEGARLQAALAERESRLIALRREGMSVY